MEEIELTYLAKELPTGLTGFPKREMVDIFIPAAAEHPSLRIRKSGDKYEITKKETIDKNDASHQYEATIPLTAQEYGELGQLPGKRTHKTRYYYQNNGIDYEIDVFEGDLAGLVVVDVEFKSLEDKTKFKMPEFCLCDITQEVFIAGGMVCGKKYSDIVADLERFGYKQLFLK